MPPGKGELGVAGFILAGGRSTRFGRDKALAEVGGVPMLAHMIELLRRCAKEVKLIAAPRNYAGFGAEIVVDRWPGEGPLGGIITALEYAANGDAACDWNLILSCDMPFLTEDWLKFLAERAAQSRAQVVLPRSAHGPEPLCACYRTDTAGALRAAFQSGVRKVTDGLKPLRTEILDEADWKRFDSSGRLFWNMNTAADYEEVRRMMEAERP